MKECRVCGPTDNQFEVRRGKETTRCLVCARKYWNDYYAAHPDFRKKIVRKNRKNRKLRVAEVAQLKAKPCVDCKQSYPSWVMQYDHCSGEKSHNVGTMAASGLSMEAIHREIVKCELLCSNCHAHRTHLRRLGVELYVL